MPHAYVGELPKLLAKHRNAHLIDGYSDERADDDPIYCYLVNGWYDPENPGCHVIVEGTVKAVATILGRVQKCDCEDCEGH